MKKQKFMRSMEFRKNLPATLKNVQSQDTEIIVMHYDDPVAKLIKIGGEEAAQLKIDMKNKKG